MLNCKRTRFLVLYVLPPFRYIRLYRRQLPRPKISASLNVVSKQYDVVGIQTSISLVAPTFTMAACTETKAEAPSLCLTVVHSARSCLLKCGKVVATASHSGHRICATRDGVWCILHIVYCSWTQSLSSDWPNVKVYWPKRRP